MSIFDFMQRLLPTVGKDKLLDDVRETKQTVDLLMESYGEASRVFASKTFESSGNNTLSTGFLDGYMDEHVTRVRKRKELNHIQAVASALQNIKTNLLFVEEQITNVMSSDILKEGLTSKKALLVRASDHMAVMTDMLVDLLSITYIQESEAIGKKNDLFEISKQAAKRLKDNLVKLGSMVAIYSNEPHEFTKLQRSAVDIKPGSDANDIARSMYNTHSDPYGITFGFSGNPIWAVRDMYTDWVVYRHDRVKDRRAMLKAQLAVLESQRDGGDTDPALVNRINKYMDAIADLEYKMSKLES